MPDIEDRYKQMIVETHTIVKGLQKQNELLFDNINGIGGLKHRVTKIETTQISCLKRAENNESKKPQSVSNIIALISTVLIVVSLFISPIWSKYIGSL